MMRDRSPRPTIVGLPRGTTVKAMSSKDALIADLYESVLRPDRIPDVLDRINRYLDCDGIHVVGKDQDTGSVVASVAVGPQIYCVERDYLAHYLHVDPRLSIGSAHPTGVVAACRDFLDDRYVSASDVYQDFLIPSGAGYVIGGNVYRRCTKSIHVGINRLIGRPQLPEEKQTAASEFMYHLSRWARQLVIADKVRDVVTAGFFALETLGQGILIVDDRQHVLFANQAANQLLGEVLTARGLLRSWAHGATLGELLKQVTADRQTRSTTALHTVGGRTVPLLFSLVPLPREQGIGFTILNGSEATSRAKAGADGQAGAMHPGGGASVLVLVRPQVDAQATGHRLYQQAFGFTAAETRLADALASGQSPKDYADRARLSIATVRTHIRALLSKTGAANLRALVVLLASLPRSNQ